MKGRLAEAFGRHFPRGGRKRAALLLTASLFYSYSATVVSGILVARMLSPADYAVKAIVFSIVNVGLIFADLGMINAVMKAASVGGERRAREVASTALAFSLATHAVVFAIIALAAPAFESIYGPGTGKYIVALCIAVFARMIGSTVSYYNFARKMTGRVALANVANGTVYFLVTFCFVYFAQPRFFPWSRLEGFFYSLILVFALDSAVRFIGFRPAAVRLRLLPGLVRTGFLTSLSALFIYVVQNYDNLILGIVAPREILGYYALAYLSFLPLTFVGSAMSSVAFADIRKGIIGGARRQARKLVGKVIGYSVLACAGAGAVIGLAFYLLTTFFLKRYVGALPFVFAMIPAFALEAAVNQNVASLLVAAGKENRQLFARGVQLLVTAPTGVALMLSWGTWGAVAALWIFALAGAGIFIREERALWG